MRESGGRLLTGVGLTHAQHRLAEQSCLCNRQVQVDDRTEPTHLAFPSAEEC